MKSNNTIRDNKTAIEKEAKLYEKARKVLFVAALAHPLRILREKEKHGKQLIF